MSQKLLLGLCWSSAAVIELKRKGTINKLFFGQLSMAMVILVNARPLSNLSVNANCRVPASVKRLVHRTVPLASSVGGDAQRTFSSITAKWMNPVDLSTVNYNDQDFQSNLKPIPIVTKTQTDSKILGAYRQALEQFVHLLRRSIEDFRTLAGGKTTAKQLRHLVIRLRNLINTIKLVESNLNTGVQFKPSHNNSSSRIKPTTIPTNNTRVGFNATTTSLNSHQASVRVVQVLNQLYSDLLFIQLGLHKLSLRPCLG